MKKPLFALLLLVLVSACGSGGGGNNNTPPVGGPTPAEQLAADLQGLSLDALYADSFAALITRSPEAIVWQSLESVYPLASVTLDDLSDSYQRDTYAMYQVVLDALHSYDRSALDAEGQLNYDIYEWYLQDVVDQLEFIYYDFVATYSIFGVQEDTRQLFTEVHPLATLQDAENYITRLNLVEQKFDQLIDHLELQRQNGVVEPALSMQIAINQVSALAQGGTLSNPYYTNFVAGIASIPGLSNAQRSDLESRAFSAVDGGVKRAYQQLRSSLQNLLSNAPPSIGVGQYARGGDYYTYKLRHHTTTDLTAAEIHQLGLDELIRIQAEMRLIFDQLGYPQNETVTQLFARVAADGGIIPAANVLSTYEDIIDLAEQRVDEAFDIFPSANVIVIPDEFGGYYIGPSFDGTRPGAFYAGTSTDQPWFQMRSLAYHEAVPGHHTQVAIAMEQDVPAFRKGGRFTAFVEGWALYAERLAWELGWHEDDPYSNLGRLQYEALRAARLVMDTGIHNLGWSFDEAVQFNRDAIGWSLGESQGAAARYSVWPGQATAYMIGMLQILDARQRAMDELGGQFDIKAFHRAVLSNGAVPLALLDTVVDRYIAETLGMP
ncbi:MAG: DUF885 domain-containing protein [Gammaproteobacteria bacterium]|jgi:uncharacterized protein (DUF885 family)|nr:DUF885 domain-containing protein [Gammaproteobacteria bacterium]MDH3749286.1 DUF885 domain-containing protein [Gammaproteobacteria bacterium]MDH3805622.1 DUF885 domain-containing protein [Gammaproteobacteria bacterium]